MHFALKEKFRDLPLLPSSTGEASVSPHTKIDSPPNLTNVSLKIKSFLIAERILPTNPLGLLFESLRREFLLLDLHRGL